MITRRAFLSSSGLAALSSVAPNRALAARSRRQTKLSGRILDVQSRPIAGARVTLFTTDLSFFQEVRSDRRGRYRLTAPASGNYHLGALVSGLEYREAIVSLTGANFYQDFGLAVDMHPGSWEQGPTLAASPCSGALLANGQAFFTRDGSDAVLWDPGSGTVTPAPAPGAGPVDYAAALLPDGRLALLGGGDPITGVAASAVRTFNPSAGWIDGPPLQAARRLPAAARMADGRVLLAGGGVSPVDPDLASCEVVDLGAGTATLVGSLARPVRSSRLATLGAGGLLATWDAPQRTTSDAAAWQDAAPFLQPKRADLESCPSGDPPAGDFPRPGDLPDHDIALLPDGRVGVFGVRRTAVDTRSSLLEIYDPAHDTWTLGATPLTLRSSPVVLPLPNGQVLMLGGRKEDPSRPEPVDSGCRLRLAHLYDPGTDVWFRMSDMAEFRDARSIPILLPDGRVAIAGGTGALDSDPAAVAVFRPSYFYRGVRPRIETISSTSLSRGGSVDLKLTYTSSPSSVVLVPLTARSRSGQVGQLPPVALHVRPHGNAWRCTLPSDAMALPDGPYLLFVLVEDLPSEGRIVSVG